MIKPMLRALGLLAVANLAAVVVPCAAQTTDSEQSWEVRDRNECRLASQILLSGHPAVKLPWATERIETCADLGPAALASRWRTVSGTGASLDQLTRSSMRLHDGRLYADLMDIAQDATRPPAVRAAAMLVLAKYVNPSSAAWLTDLIPPDSILSIPSVAGSTTASVYTDGAVPLPTGYRQQVLFTLDRLAANRMGQPRHVWYAAARLSRRVRFDVERLHRRPDAF